MSFSWSDYAQELKSVVTGWRPDRLFKRVLSRSFYRPTFAQVMEEKKVESGAELKRTLTGLDLLMFGVGADPCCSIACRS
jgi:hypothetical protein